MRKELSQDQLNELLQTVKTRFEMNQSHHKEIEWNQIQKKLVENPEKLWSLFEMERTGGEPDVVGIDTSTKEYLFYDCSKESPIGRRNTCYDNEALDARKEYKPKDSAINMAREMGIDLLTEKEYRQLQELGDFDLKTSSWVKTPETIRKLDGAVFCDRRYNNVFIYHNGASSYYSSRGFRGVLKV